MIRILNAVELSRKDIFIRDEDQGGVEEAVATILADVRQRGDEALRHYTREFDGVELRSLELSDYELDRGFCQADPQLVEILFLAAERIRDFHSNQRSTGFTVTQEDGVILGQKVTPLERVGIYIPGGTAAYPSSVLMNAIPARLAGVKEIVMVTPPGPNGIPAPILAAARVAGVDRVFQIGGAQAVAALAFGTQSVPRVDKITGPGNQYVAEAKKQVFGQVDIDMIAGPSEILVIGDGSCNPAFVAADLLAQAEHDRNASAVLVTDSQALAEAVQRELEMQLETLSRREIARESIDKNGKIIIVKDMTEAVELANEIAPEHLEICVDNPFDYLSGIQNAGSVFLGKHTPEALGDYFAGPNHTLPTGGTARFSSPLSVDDFVKKVQYMSYTPQALSKVASSVAYFARKEGLAAHARSVTLRVEEEGL